MDIKSVKQLAEMMEQYGLAELEVQEGENRIALVRQAAVTVTAAAPQTPAPAAESPAQQAPVAEAAGEALTSPLVGVVYLAPAPDAPVFVKVGDKVEKGRTLCIVEAMKVMNEFTAPRDGEVAEVCVQNGDLVECGQCLFRIV